MLDPAVILHKVGLTEQEARVYLALLELREARTGKLCHETKIASSNIYNVIDKLLKKGLVNFKLVNNIKVFMPSPPEVLNDLFLEKQNTLDQERQEIGKVITQLKAKPPEELPQLNFKYFEGIAGIKAMWHEIDSRMKGDSTLKIYGGRVGVIDRFLGFFKSLHDSWKERELKTQIIFDIGETPLAKKRTNKFSQTRILKLDNEAEWGVYEDIFYIHYYPIHKKPYGFLIKDPVLVQTLDQVFNQVWSLAKKPR